MKTRKNLRLRVDPVACDGFGYCAELLPELVCADEWGFPLLSDAPVPERLVSLARRAVAQCPRRALTLVPEPGQAPEGEMKRTGSTSRSLRT